MGSFAGGAVNPSSGVNPRSYSGSGMKSLVNGGISGLAGGLAADATGWLLNQANKEFGDCGCGS